jgi:exopolyphosphatase/guanosine-5'-triphosphate,3'-diphosphate pyrophosphatase
VREASNGKDFVRRAKQELGLDIEVIGARQEALLAFFSVQRAFDLTDKHVAVVDIGGGSTEIVLAFGDMVEAIYATDLGAVRLTELYGGAGMTNKDFERMIAGIDRRLRKHTKNPVFVPHILFGSGGTFTALASMVMASKGQSGLRVRGYQVSRAEVRHLLDRLRKLPVKDRAAVPGLSPDRADIIIAGLAIIDRVMERLEVNMVQAHNRGVRDGLLLTMIDQSLGDSSQATPPAAPHDREAAIDRMVANCGGGIEHGQHVARLAGQMYAQLVESFALDPADQSLLEAAARLQDVGYLIDYDHHHKHSYHLILNSRLAGFQPHELEIVANVARYHRGANPKRKHANFEQLSAADQDRVKKMAGVLRLAGGFDRSNTQQVQTVEVRRKKDKVELRVPAYQCPEVDLWAARRRSRLFEKAFDVSVKIMRVDSEPAIDGAKGDRAKLDEAKSGDRAAG